MLKERFDIVRHFSTPFAPENLEHKLHFSILHLNLRLNFRTESRFYEYPSKIEKIIEKNEIFHMPTEAWYQKMFKKKPFPHEKRTPENPAALSDSLLNFQPI